MRIAADIIINYLRTVIIFLISAAFRKMNLIKTFSTVSRTYCHVITLLALRVSEGSITKIREVIYKHLISPSA